jgi:hypothetical protein
MNRNLHALLAVPILALAAGCGGSEGGGSIIFDASGEVLALGGYSFPPASPEDPVFVDGWDVHFDEVLVALDKLTISENPDMDPGDESRTGAVVAEVDGPWILDLHKGGPLPGKGQSGEQALEIARLDGQNKNGDKPFEADQRYAFGFDVVAATGRENNLNLDDSQKADHDLMIAKGYSVLYVGTATWKGGGDCSPAGPEFAKLPTTLKFKLGFASPTTYVNCQNPDNDPAKPLGDEESERGIIVKANQPIRAQITIHTDHPFWESFVHDAPLHFDMIAAQYAGATGTPTAVLEDMKGVDPTAITAKDGAKLAWRTCTSFYTPPWSGQMSFDTLGIRQSKASDPSVAIRDLYDFMTYNQSTQGHLNSDGLCAVVRGYPSPP